MASKAYLAEKYMSGPKADAILAREGPKKKKRKAPAPSPASKSFIVDTDGGWGDEARDEMEEVEEPIVASDQSFKKRRLHKEESPPPAADEQPQIVVEEAPVTGGLLSAKQLKKALPQSNVNPVATAEEIALAQETAARLKREREEKESQKMEWGKEKLRRELEKQRGTKFARHADDADLNEAQKTKELWNDPAAQFLTGPRRPEYSGPTPAPNRFGIKPGYRWDGVDRGNGFEKKMFQRLNEKKRMGAETYQWSAEDM
ncbi:Pre-mRNA-splicing factor of RES complex-domain-containing protein [Mycena amicta]|nr:Pre-mRNA-splicing factor of RES complex-domain-containing protein [Mycena amicta]